MTTVKTRRRGRAAVYAPRYVGRVNELPNGWQAWSHDGTGPDEFAGWAATRRGAVELLHGRHPDVRHQHADAVRACAD